MNTSQMSWSEAVDTACTPMGATGARERRRHARGFASWMEGIGRAAADARASDLDPYLATMPAADRKLRSKVRCSLRAVLKVQEPLGLGERISLGVERRRIDAVVDTPLGALIRMVAEQAPDRVAVRLSAITRWLVWAAEVDADPLLLDHGDLPQFRRWLRLIRVRPGEIMVVARDLLDLRHSESGRAILGERQPERRPMQLEQVAPLTPRFRPEDVRPWDPLSTFGPEVTLRPWVGLAAPKRGGRALPKGRGDRRR